MQNGAGLGFASFGTNAGYTGSVGYELFLNQPQVINDFGYGAIHVEAEVNKELARQYYGTATTKLYYAGYSTGAIKVFKMRICIPRTLMAYFSETRVSTGYTL
ncbi:uncharacterized protein F4812DRAFT_415065 [Daldinia caldariorum]|uniref:uncharacterized protein n=1 Tax=Daldinia caldariorum TaxID=326644 RepID=UPI0020071F3A|nr:uncharacterized protein F4812DRAFT_415065 [Daldinia caldariorum]KAI1471668.1 hypothetical protein F4812DRAFT_415065 [Daldinia caldariorum]